VGVETARAAARSPRSWRPSARAWTRCSALAAGEGIVDKIWRCARSCARQATRWSRLPRDPRAGRAAAARGEGEQASCELQGESPLIMPSVERQAVPACVADWTGIPVGRMVKNELERCCASARRWASASSASSTASDMIARRIQTSRAQARQPEQADRRLHALRHLGVGKTETALALAEALYGGEQNVITINMSEFQEAHTVSTLKGAPPGYVGYGEGGILTEAVRRRPYSVVLLDEVEKAHSDVHELFFQVFDKGGMEDGEGRQIDFKNTIILLTSQRRLGADHEHVQGPELLPDPESLASALQEPLMKVFPPALLGRLVTIPYYPPLRRDARPHRAATAGQDQEARREQPPHPVQLQR
jgi:type VI secretion system protein VasG